MRRQTLGVILAILVACVAFYGLVWCGCTGIGLKSTRTQENASGDNSPNSQSGEKSETTQNTTNTDASGGSRVNNVTIAAGGGYAVALLLLGLTYRSRSGWKREADGWTRATTRLVAALEHGKRSQLTAENVCNYVKSHPKDDSEKRINQRVKVVEAGKRG